MKKLTTTILACGLLASGLHQASALSMRLSADGGVTWTTVDDNGPLDADAGAGFITYNGPVGGWALSISSALGAPGSGSATAPQMDVSSSDLSSGPASLIIQLSDKNFAPFNNETFIATITGSTDGTVTYKTFRDTGNVLFGSTSTYPGDPASPSATASLLMAAGPFVASSIVSSNGVVVAAGGVSPYSLTLETTVVHTGGGFTSTDASLKGVPPPCNCSLVFNAPASVTNCPGTALVDVTASENCGSGSVPVSVNLVGITTNGTCPQIITRSYTATDDCGNAHTFTQTTTVNCKPNCTITPSVTIAMVGGTYTASVADAGVGATYLWSVSNGSIVMGQNTPTLTWSAGTDTSSLIVIGVTITAGTGCQSTCSANVSLTKPPGLGGGDTATIGFWHNKNGQGLILGASNSPALGNWLASNFPCMYGSLAGQPNKVVADLFLADFAIKGQNTYAQVLAGAFACYFTSSNLGGNSNSTKFGFNLTPGGTGGKVFNVGSQGTVLGLQNNTSYTILQILQAANSKCPFGTSGAVFDALNTIFDGINQGGDIS